MDTESVRTITEIIDVETGEFMHVNDAFFRQNEAYLFLLRRRLYEYAYLRIGQPKYVCAACRQPVVLLGRKTKRAQVVYFAHYKDSDDCPIKTHGGDSKEHIERSIYIGETESHIELKHQISCALQTSHINGVAFSHIKEEERIASKLDFRSWAVPDVYAECGELKINFEVQLSTLFLSTIIERDIFYRFHNIFILWIFAPGAINNNTISQKDIIWANNGNILIYDQRARELTEQMGELTLLCRWYEFTNDDNDNVRLTGGKYLTLSELTFDRETNSAYYVDVARDIEKRCPNFKKDRAEMEQIKLESLDEFKVWLDGVAPTKDEVMASIKKGLYKPRWIKKGNYFGYTKYGHTIIPFIYNQAEEFVDGLAIVRRNRKYGVVNVFGEEIVEPKYKSIEVLDKYIKFTSSSDAISVMATGIPWLFETTLDIDQQIANLADNNNIDQIDKKEIVNILESSSDSIYKKGIECEKKGQPYLYYYRVAADMGYAPALNRVGLWYRKEENTEQSNQLAAEYYSKAAEQGYASAQWNLALCYDSGSGVSKDYEQALKLLMRAAKQGHKLAQNRLGVYYEKGLGVETNPQKAAEYYLLSAEQGYVYAQYNLALCYEKGEGFKQNYEQAFLWLKKAAEQGHIPARKKLGEYYASGLGCMKDVNKAEKLRKLVAEFETKLKRKKYLEKLQKEEGDKRCPRCNNTLVIRNGCRGHFYGCSNFPKCRYTEDIDWNRAND